jgi:dihydrofolate reductase
MGDMPQHLLHHWMFDEPEKHKTELDSLMDAGAFIMGSKMFAPNGKIADDWRGWWDKNPPYHTPVFVLTSHARDTMVMEGGTSFTFVTDGIISALQQAKLAAGDRDVAIAGGAYTVNHYLAAGLLDELWLHIVPVIIGGGSRLFENMSGLELRPVEVRTTEMVTHVRYKVLGTKS